MKHLALFSSCHWEVGKCTITCSTPHFHSRNGHHDTNTHLGCHLATCMGKPAPVCTPGLLWEHAIGLGGYQDCRALNFHRKERHSFSITLLLHLAFVDSKDHLYLFQAEQFSFILCPGQARQFTTQKNQNNNLPPLSKSATVLCQIIQKED